MKAFETKRQAVNEVKRLVGEDEWLTNMRGIKVFHKRGDKRKKSWFVGTQLEWLNK